VQHKCVTKGLPPKCSCNARPSPSGFDFDLTPHARWRHIAITSRPRDHHHALVAWLLAGQDSLTEMI